LGSTLGFRGYLCQWPGAWSASDESCNDLKFLFLHSTWRREENHTKAVDSDLLKKKDNFKGKF
jgi:hypothetical protein